MEQQGRQGAKTYASDTVQAPPEIRDRLGMGDPDAHRHDVMRTFYEFSSGNGDDPWVLCTSWEPLRLTKGTVIASPEAGPYAGLGSPHRMAAVGVTVDTWHEDVWARPATSDEAKRLGIGAGSIVMMIARAYHTSEQVVEVADIIVAAESTKLACNGPVGDR
ncbi:UTRA domain-containing protein [Nonomuraea insulae]|uniref:UTRA domain-containing protein n=1 Tax=Nonomuraea insulae TaxID=1616787 RepID=A0ABW1CK63_9ACTN